MKMTQGMLPMVLVASAIVVFMNDMNLSNHVLVKKDFVGEDEPNHTLKSSLALQNTASNVKLNSSNALDRSSIAENDPVDGMDTQLRAANIKSAEDDDVTRNDSNDSLDRQADRESDASNAKHVVAVCFFGQVKNYDRVASSIHEHILRVLKAKNFEIEFYAHTFNETSFTNPRNRERNLLIDPYSLQKYFAANVGHNITIVYDHVSAADQTVDLNQLLKYGDPWPDNPRISVRNLGRQLYSLKRLTQLWAPNQHRYKYCLYIRPDLVFSIDLDLNRTLPLLSNSTISTPFFGHAGGLNDRLAVGTPAVMQVYGSRGDLLLDYVLRLKRQPHAETFLLHTMQSHGIRNIGSTIEFERMRADGSRQLL
jgi:hypothetical protein